MDFATCASTLLSIMFGVISRFFVFLAFSMSKASISSPPESAVEGTTAVPSIARRRSNLMELKTKLEQQMAT